MTTPTLPFDAPEYATFDGETYDPSLDKIRLGRQALTVFQFLRDGRWWTLGEIANGTGYPEASVSARLRDFRKARFGAHDVQRRRVNLDLGTWEYRLVVNPQARLDLSSVNTASTNVDSDV